MIKDRRWLVLLGLSLTYAVTNGILVHTLPLLYPQLIDSFGWSQSEVTLPATIFLIANALTSIPAGMMLDKFSPIKIIGVGLLAIIGGLFAFSQVQTLWQLVAVYALMAAGLSACGLVSNMLVLSRWFVHLRGRATGILLMSSSAGGTVFPLILGSLIEGGNWRLGMQVMSIMT
ncbi:MAG: MFS transporter, partial [Pseudomonadota bacterium]|nr:MFS transporter [Pseudomonadota bacterium]